MYLARFVFALLPSAIKSKTGATASNGCFMPDYFDAHGD